MTDAAKILKGYRNHRKLGEARDIAEYLSDLHARPVHINEQTPKTITTTDGRVRTTFAGWYLSLTAGEQTIETFAPEGWVAPEPDETGRLAKEQREHVASKAKEALEALAAEMAEELGEDHAQQVETMVATWARRIPGEGWGDLAKA